MSLDTGTPMADKFKSLASTYAAFSRRAGYEVVPFKSSSLPFFSKLPVEQKREVLSALEVCVRICASTEREGSSVRDSRALIWQAIRTFQLRQPSDFFSYVDTESDIIEMHSPLGLQIFRTFNFYELCSYSLEELYSIHWAELYGRDSEVVTPQIMSLMSRIFSGEARTTFPAEVTPHRVFELISERKLELLLDIRHAAPLFHEGTSLPGASIVVESARFAEARPSKPTQRSLNWGT